MCARAGLCHWWWRWVGAYGQGLCPLCVSKVGCWVQWCDAECTFARGALQSCWESTFPCSGISLLSWCSLGEPAGTGFAVGLSSTFPTVQCFCCLKTFWSASVWQEMCLGAADLLVVFLPHPIPGAMELQ